MLTNIATSIVTAVIIVFNSVTAQPKSEPKKVLSSREFSLEDRYAVPSVNEVFKKNILLNLAYLNRSVTQKTDINWDKVEGDFTFNFTLKPNQVFAYHDDVLSEYENKLALTTNAHFGPQEGFVSDGYLYGDGVCHLASLINWAAQDAGLEVKVTKNHNFATIPDVPKEYGVSIYTVQGVKGSGAHNNLYITNNRSTDVQFNFEYKDDDLKVYVTEA